MSNINMGFIPDPNENEYIELIKKGKALNAIKKYQKNNGCDIQSATVYINELKSRLRSSVLDAAPEPAAQSVAPSAAANTADDAKYIEIIKSGAKLQAVKEYMEDHGISLSEAKNYIDALAERIGR